MTNVITTVEAIKKVYLGTAADLSGLLLLLADQLAEEGVPSDAHTANEVDELARLLGKDIQINNVRSVAVARLHNKMSPPSFRQQKRIIPSYLKLVASN